MGPTEGDVEGSQLWRASWCGCSRRELLKELVLPLIKPALSDDEVALVSRGGGGAGLSISDPTSQKSSILCK